MKKQPLCKAAMLFILLLVCFASDLQTQGGTSRTKAGNPPTGIYFDYHGMSPEDNKRFLDHPLVDGVLCRISWKEVEPEPGQYNFEKLDLTIKPWIETGKGVALGISLAGQHNENTPEWVYEKVTPVAYERKSISVKVPRYWDQDFLPVVEGLIRAFGRRYNGDSSINAVLVGPAHIGFLTAMPNSDGAKAFVEAGWTPDNYKNYVYGLTELYARMFPNTHLWMRGANMLIKISKPQEYGFQGAPGFTDLRDEILTHVAAAYNCTVGFNALEADRRAYHMTGVPEFLHRLGQRVKEGLHGLEVSDDWPMWLNRERRMKSAPPANRLSDQTDQTMNEYFASCMKNAVGGASGIPESNITLMKLLSSDLEPSLPGHPNFQQEVFDATAWVREVMKRNAVPLTK